MKKLLLASVLILAACSSGAEFIESETGNQEVIVFGGRLAASGIDRHDFVVQNSGLVRFTLTELVAIDHETGERINNAVLAIVLGRPQDSGECKTSSTNFLAENTDFQLFLVVEPYCLRVARPSTMHPETVIDYVLTLTVQPE